MQGVGIGVYPDKGRVPIILPYGFHYAQPPVKIDFTAIPHANYN
jgi:hypothetical protein